MQLDFQFGDELIIDVAGKKNANRIANWDKE
jgi:hypothetical protein